jgi:hypothetical protein
MAGLEPARTVYGPTDFKSVDFPRRNLPVDKYLTIETDVHPRAGFVDEIMPGSFTVRQSKTILARSCEVQRGSVSACQN